MKLCRICQGKIISNYRKVTCSRVCEKINQTNKSKKWYAENTEKQKTYMRIYYKKPEWIESHRRSSRIYRHNYRQLFGGRDRGDFTAKQWRALKEVYGVKCALCFRPMIEPDSYYHKPSNVTIDHILPVSKGGKSTLGNIVPSCWSCNGSRHAKTIEEFLGVTKAVYFKDRHMKALQAIVI